MYIGMYICMIFFIWVSIIKLAVWHPGREHNLVAGSERVNKKRECFMKTEPKYYLARRRKVLPIFFFFCWILKSTVDRVQEILSFKAEKFLFYLRLKGSTNSARERMSLNLTLRESCLQYKIFLWRFVEIFFSKALMLLLLLTFIKLFFVVIIVLVRD